MEGEKQEILSLEEKQVQAFNEKKIDTLLSFFDPDLTGFSSTKHMRLASLSELKKTFEYYFSQAQDISYTISDPCVNLYGETAVLTFYWKVAFRGGTKRNPVSGRGTHVYRRGEKGWKIVHEHFSRAHHAYEKSPAK